MKTSFTKSETKTRLAKQLLSNDYIENMRADKNTTQAKPQDAQLQLSLAYEKVRETHGRVRSFCESNLSSQKQSKSLFENCDALLKMTASAIKTIQSNPKYHVLNV